jgi:hypothetical protein
MDDAFARSIPEVNSYSISNFSLPLKPQKFILMSDRKSGSKHFLFFNIKYGYPKTLPAWNVKLVIFCCATLIWYLYLAQFLVLLDAEFLGTHNVIMLINYSQWACSWKIDCKFCINLSL